MKTILRDALRGLRPVDAKGRERLTEQEQKEVTALAIEGKLSQSEIGRIYGISQPTVSEYKRGIK
jgi:DNA-binding CsgD family transcriptional regulator